MYIRPVNNMLTAKKLKPEECKTGLLVVQKSNEDRFEVLECCDNCLNIYRGDKIICPHYTHIVMDEFNEPVYLIKLDHVMAVLE
jgi:co-chaperonin GroES (HSP10)